MVTLGLVVSRFNASVTDEMAERARAAAEGRGAEIVETISVPGAYDTPLAADRLARRDEIDAVAVIGAIVTGETDHDQVIARAAAAGLTEVSVERDTPVTLGITGPGMDPEQARARIGNAGTAVESAIDLAESYQ